MRPSLRALCRLSLAALLSACSSGQDSGSGSGAASTAGGTSTPTSPTGSGGTATQGTIDAYGFLSNAASITHSTVNDGSASIIIADGTSAKSYNLTVAGVQRRYVVITPNGARFANAPVLLMLHPDNTSPENMAYLSEVSDYVLTQGFWAVLPEAIGGKWDDDPGTADTASSDTPFLSALIDALPGLGGVDLDHLYAAGFSNGGFMTERLACELPDKIAAFGIVAATLRNTLSPVCHPAQPRSKFYFLGTADLIVPYNGDFSGTATGLQSAAGTLAFWAASGQQACGGAVSTATGNGAGSGTSVQQDDYTGCAAGTRLRLDTVTGGGHAWPGGEPLTGVGTVSQQIQATGLIWQFATPYSR